MTDVPLRRRAFLNLSVSVLASPFQRALAAATHCPILMYHYLSDAAPDADPTRRDLSVSPALFAAHLDTLAQDGYSAIHLRQLLDFLSGGATLPERPIVLSFDDGYADLLGNALPLLQDYGFTASSFIVSGFVGQPGYLSWDNLQALAVAGIEIGSHSRSHPDLTTLSRSQLDAEIEGASLAIEASLGFRPSVFCYPFGKFNSSVIRALRRAGIHGAVTTQDGTLHSLAGALTWRRVRVRGNTSPTSLRWLIERRV